MASPWQFAPETYGALGDGKVITDATIAGGALSTLTSATANFTGSDTGKYMMVNGAAGTTSAPLISKITFVSATAVTLTTPASNAVTNTNAMYGTDDLPAFLSARTAGAAYAISSGAFRWQLVLGSKIYIWATGPTQVGDGSTVPTFNSQFPVSYNNAAGTTNGITVQKLITEIVGAGDNSAAQLFTATVPDISGSAIVSMVFAPASGGDPTFGKQSVIGGPTGGSGFGSPTQANSKLVLNGVKLVAPALAQQVVVDGRFLAGMDVWRSSAMAWAAPQSEPVGPAMNTFPAKFAAGGFHSVGFWFPLVGNNDDNNVDSLYSAGFLWGVAFQEHFRAGRMVTLYGDAGGYANVPGGAVISHGASIGYWSVESCNHCVQTQSGAGAAQFPMNIGLLDIERSGAQNDIDDANNIFTGEVHWASFLFTTPTVNGAKNLRIINDRLGPGHMASPPAVPASTSTATLVYRDAWVSIHTGVGVTVSAVTIDGTATGLTMAASSSLAVRVPNGKTIALTYAGGTPTWDWWLD